MAHEESYHALIGGDGRGVWPSMQRGALWAVGVGYGWAMRVRNRLFDRGWKRVGRAPVPVVSVGNLTLGGTGKTPCVEYLARFYRDRGVRVAILSRGYGAEDGPNDEALVLEENLPDVPHLQGADRVELARAAAVEHESELLILDDGFQHRRLHRDLDMVLVDATQPWGHGHMFPRGLLREPPESLGRAGLVLLTRCDQAEPDKLEELQCRVKKVAPAAPVVETRHAPVAWINTEHDTRSLCSFVGRPVAAFCGIGNPEAFRRSLEAIGMELVSFKVFPDHHDYTRRNVEDLRAWARAQPGDCILATTQKDLVKLQITHLGERELWALRIQLKIDKGQDVLEERLLKVVRVS